MRHPVSEDNKKSRRLRCKIGGCTKYYATSSSLSRHKRQHGPNALHYTCPVCGMSCDQKGNLLDHIRSRHSDKRPYPCLAPGCDKAFSIAGYRTRHRKTCKYARSNEVVLTGQSPLPQQLAPTVDAGTAFEESSIVPSSPEYHSEIGSPYQHMSTSTPSQSRSDIDSDEDMLGRPPTPSPRACGLYLPEMVIPSTTSTTRLLFVDNNGGTADPYKLKASFPSTPAPLPRSGSPLLPASPDIGKHFLPPFNFNSLNASLRSDKGLDSGFASSSSSKDEQLSPMLWFDFDGSSSPGSSSPPSEWLKTSLLQPEDSGFDKIFLSLKEGLDAFHFPIF